MANKKLFKQVFVLLFLAILLTGCSHQVTTDTNSNTDEVNKLTTDELESKYKSELIAVLKPFWVDNNFIGLKDQILALTAPGKYLDLHFNMVVAFELMEQGQKTSSQEKIEEGLEKISELEKQYPWIK